MEAAIRMRVKRGILSESIPRVPSSRPYNRFQFPIPYKQSRTLNSTEFVDARTSLYDPSLFLVYATGHPKYSVASLFKEPSMHSARVFGPCTTSSRKSQTQNLAILSWRFTGTLNWVVTVAIFFKQKDDLS